MYNILKCFQILELYILVWTLLSSFVPDNLLSSTEIFLTEPSSDISKSLWHNTIFLDFSLELITWIIRFDILPDSK